MMLIYCFVFIMTCILFSSSFSVVVDPSNLCDGLHYFEVYGIDCKAPWRGPLFRIPITITKAKAVTSQVSFSNMFFQPGLHLSELISMPFDGVLLLRFKLRSTYKYNAFQPKNLNCYPGAFVFPPIHLMLEIAVSYILYHLPFTTLV